MLRDYLDKDLLRHRCSVEDAALIAAIILTIIHRGKLLRSKNSKLTREMIVPNINVVPEWVRKYRELDEWVDKIARVFEGEALKELTLEDAQGRFLTILARYPVMFSSHYALETLIEDPGPHFPQRTLCVVNINGIHFYDNVKLERTVQSIDFTRLLHIFGCERIVRLAFLEERGGRTQEHRLELKGSTGRAVAEDVISYVQL